MNDIRFRPKHTKNSSEDLLSQTKTWKMTLSWHITVKNVSQKRFAGHVARGLSDDKWSERFESNWLQLNYLFGAQRDYVWGGHKEMTDDLIKKTDNYIFMITLVSWCISWLLIIKF